MLWPFEQLITVILSQNVTAAEAKERELRLMEEDSATRRTSERTSASIAGSEGTCIG